MQLRLGRDGQWYRFVRRFGDWDLAGPPDPDPSVVCAPLDQDRA